MDALLLEPARLLLGVRPLTALSAYDIPARKLLRDAPLTGRLNETAKSTRGASAGERCMETTVEGFCNAMSRCQFLPGERIRDLRQNSTGSGGRREQPGAVHRLARRPPRFERISGQRHQPGQRRAVVPRAVSHRRTDRQGTNGRRLQGNALVRDDRRAQGDAPLESRPAAPARSVSARGQTRPVRQAPQRRPQFPHGGTQKAALSGDGVSGGRNARGSAVASEAPVGERGGRPDLSGVARLAGDPRARTGPPRPEPGQSHAHRR